MTARTLRDLKPGDVVNDYGTHRTVAGVVASFDDHGYPLRTVTYEDGEVLMHSPSYEVEVVET